MQYSAPNYGIKPSPTPTNTQSAKRKIYICIGISVGIFVLLCVLGLGLGLGLGLKKSNSSPNSDTCDARTAKCGCPSVQPSTSSRIVNGTLATANSWPWMVAIYVSNGKFCGGTLITYEHILTAAHCVFDVNNTDIIVYAGIQKLSDRQNGQVRNISTITVHPNYDDTIKVNDLAVLKLSSPLSQSTKVGLCCLSTSLSPTIGDSATFIGWGRTSANSTFSDDLLQAKTQVVNSSYCSYAPLTSNQICTGNTGSIACYGESGSPLMMKLNNYWTCVGVVNMGLLTCDSYFVFTRVSPYDSFIYNATSL